MSFMNTYQAWLNSAALSPEEKAELEGIANDPKEIESRFFDQLSFGTAGLRGTMCTGLHQMNIHIIRHTTQAFAEVIKAEGPDACRQGVAVCAVRRVPGFGRFICPTGKDNRIDDENLELLSRGLVKLAAAYQIKK